MIQDEGAAERQGVKGTMQASTLKELAWAADLVQSISGRGQFDAKGLVVASGDLRTFLDSDESSKIIVSGARGMGKSIALAYKVSKLQAGARYRVLPSIFPFMYGLAKKSIPLSGQQLHDFGVAARWRAVWLVTLGVLLASWVRREARSALSREDFPGWSHELIDEANRWAGTRDEPFSSLVGIALKLASNNLENFFNEYLLSILKERTLSLAICVDSIDEAIAYLNTAGQVHSLFSKQFDVSIEVEKGDIQSVKFGPLARGAWIAAQQGFAAAAARITSQAGYGVLVLGSLRLEARQSLPENLDDVDSKWESFIEDLRVDRAEFSEIFASNIARSDEQRLARPDAVDPVERFVGFSSIASRVVPDATEAVLDYVVRHTFHTPRGMVQIGGAIYAKLPVGISKLANIHGHQSARVVDAVNACAAEVVLKEHLSQLMPQLDSRAFDFAVAELPHNILSQIEMRRLNARYADKHPDDGRPLLDQLFTAGLIGVPKESDGAWIQYFPDYEASRFSVTIPVNAPFVVVHPALSAKRCESRPEDYYRSTFLVGSGLPCPSVFYPAAITVKRIDRGAQKQLVAEFEGEESEPIPYVKSVNSVAYCFLFSLLYALHSGKRSSVTVAEVEEAAMDLAAAGLLSEAYGHPPEEPHKYLAGRLQALDPSTAKGSVQALRDLTSWFAENLHGQWRVSVQDLGFEKEKDLCFSVQSTLTSRLFSRSTKQVFGDIDWQDIDFRVRVPRRVV